MHGGLWPSSLASAELIQLSHRLLAVIVAVLVIWTARRVRQSVLAPRARWLAGLAVALVLVQVALGAANVWSRLSALFVVPHLAVGAALWATLVLLYLALRRSPVPEAAAHDEPVIVERRASPCAPTSRSPSPASSSCCW